MIRLTLPHHLTDLAHSKLFVNPSHIMAVGREFGEKKTAVTLSNGDCLCVLEAPDLIVAQLNQTAGPANPAADEADLRRIREAVARGWCYPANETKVMDVDLANAIADEVFKAMRRGG